MLFPKSIKPFAVGTRNLFGKDTSNNLMIGAFPTNSMVLAKDALKNAVAIGTRKKWCALVTLDVNKFV